MNILADFWQVARRGAAVGGSWLMLAAAAWAQPPGPAAPADDAPSFAMSYGLVILGITLGLAFVLHSSNRRERAKPETYGSAK